MISLLKAKTNNQMPCIIWNINPIIHLELLLIFWSIFIWAWIMSLVGAPKAPLNEASSSFFIMEVLFCSIWVGACQVCSIIVKRNYINSTIFMWYSYLFFSFNIQYTAPDSKFLLHYPLLMNSLWKKLTFLCTTELTSPWYNISLLFRITSIIPLFYHY